MLWYWFHTGLICLPLGIRNTYHSHEYTITEIPRDFFRNITVDKCIVQVLNRVIIHGRTEYYKLVYNHKSCSQWQFWFLVSTIAIYISLQVIAVPNNFMTIIFCSPKVYLYHLPLTHCGREDLWKWTIFNTILTSPKSWLSQEDLDAGFEHSLMPMDS